MFPMTEAINTCETSLNVYQCTEPNIPEDSHLSGIISLFKNKIRFVYEKQM
jgi:hypothetical protein